MTKRSACRRRASRRERAGLTSPPTGSAPIAEPRSPTSRWSRSERDRSPRRASAHEDAVRPAGVQRAVAGFDLAHPLLEVVDVDGVGEVALVLIRRMRGRGVEDAGEGLEERVHARFAVSTVTILRENPRPRWKCLWSCLSRANSVG